LGKFRGHKRELIESFATNFYKGKIVIGCLTIPVNEEYISQVIGLSQIGEKYHSGQCFKGKEWNYFLQKSRKGTVSWKIGVIRDWFQEP